MSKNIKRVIAMVFAIGALSAVTPEAGSINNLMMTKAYAANSDGVDGLKVKGSSGSLSLYSDGDYKSSNKVDSSNVEPGKTYYAKTSSEDVEVSVSGVDSDYVRVFKGTSDSDKGYRPGSSISLSSDTTTLIVRIYSDNPGTAKYGNSTYVSQYRIKVKYTGSKDDDDDASSDNVYLKSISLSAGNITFDKKTSTYNINVDEDINKIEIGAKPDCDTNEYDDYKVRINGIKVDEDDKFKDEVDLNKGKNVIEIKVEDDGDNQRTYTLNINRGASNANDSSNNASNSNAASSDKKNQWVQVNGSWQYKDATGNSVKNTWIGNYFLHGDGNMATGWLNYGGSWYYLGSDGTKKSGWQSIDGVWYYLDSQGVMQTGWILDKNGKYYYLNSNGTMAYNTVIGGYTLGNDGAWIGR